MMNYPQVLVWGLLAIGTLSAFAHPGVPALDSGVVPRTQVLVLGTVHLREAPAGFKAGTLQALLDKLAAFKPEIITVEHIPGEECDLVTRQPLMYPPGDWSKYCQSPAAARAATGLDVSEAIAEVQRTLKHWPDRPSAAQRRQLAALFLAANDRTSALVQWLHLPPVDRRAGDDLDDSLVDHLDRLAARTDETSLIAAPLAVRLNLQRLFPIDNHTGDNIDIADGARFGMALEQAWGSARSQAKPLHDLTAALWQAGDMLRLYRLINSPKAQRIRMKSDFGAALRDDSPEHYGRIYVAGWETRNLRMVANVCAAFRERPGSRVLSIVGASHKPWFDGLLGQVQGVTVIEVERVLK
jgi:hypothetical protein